MRGEVPGQIPCEVPESSGTQTFSEKMLGEVLEGSGADTL